MARERLIAERLQKGLTQAEVAQALEISQSTVAELENGTKRPSHRMMERFAQFYGVTVDELFFAKEHRETRYDETCATREAAVNE